MTDPIGTVVGGPYYAGPGAPTYAVRLGSGPPPAPPRRAVVAGRPGARRATGLPGRVVVAGHNRRFEARASRVVVARPRPRFAQGGALSVVVVVRNAVRRAAMRRALDRLPRSWAVVLDDSAELVWLDPAKRVVVAGRPS